MFTGIVEELGTVESIDRAEPTSRLTIRSPRVLEDTAPGDSIAVDGCCLTVTEHDGTVWTADVMGPTLEVTTLGSLTTGAPVNLERSVRADARLGGHIVQGHVDGAGEVVSRHTGSDGEIVRIALPTGASDLARYVVDRGSIAVDGVSLTAIEVRDSVVSIGLIPETLSRTTLGRRPVGARVNIEVDVVAKYVENLLPTRQEALR